jgi:SAM-dependent methyltransferase
VIATSTSWPVSRFAHHLLSDRKAALYLEHADGVMTDMQAHRWCAAPTIADLSVVCRVTGPALDIGCGPGRLTRALALNRVSALGIDVTPDAVHLARSSGALAIHRSVFDPVPGHGRWQTALLIDGNVGIGGNPDVLLRRIRQLLCPTGQLIVELDHPHTRFYAGPARLCSPTAPSSSWFAWARVPIAGADDLARRNGFAVAETWTIQDRWFATLASDATR